MASPNGQRPQNGNGHVNGERPRQPLTSIMDRQPPFDLQAEVGLLGSVILMPEVLDDVGLILPNGEAFYDDAHHRLYDHLLAMHNDGRRIDDTLLVNRLKSAGDYEAIGGAAYLSKIVNAVPNAAHALYYAEIVAEKSIYRRLILRATELLRDAYDEFLPAKELLGQADSAFAVIAEAALSSVEIKPFNQMVLDALATIERRALGERAGIASGVHGYDHASNGMKPGDLIVLGGRPSTGKSALAGGIAAHVAHHHGPVCFVSLEMREQEITERFLSSESGVNFNSMVRGMMSPEERQSVATTAEQIAHWRISIDDYPSRTVAQIGAQARRIQRKHGLALLVVDYLQLIEADNPKDNREEQVAKMTRRLKMLGRELKVPILCLAQLNRQVDNMKDMRPRLSHLRECVAGDTKLIDAGSGCPVEIRNLQPGSYVLGLDAQQRVVESRVAAVWSTGEKLTYEMRTKSGRTVIATGNHPFLTAVGWKALDDIRMGDQIAVAFNSPVAASADSDPHRCRLLGYFAGNGSAQKHRTLGLIVPDADAFEDAASIIRSNWPELQIKLRANEYNDAWISRVNAAGHGWPGCNPLINWFKEIGFHGARECEKRVPAYVLQAGIVGALEFLAGYLATDGCVKFSRGRPSVQFDTTSLGLARDVCLLCSRIGVFALLSKGTWNSKSTRPIYRVSLSKDSQNVIRFACQVQPRGYRGDLLRQAAEKCGGTETRSSAFSLPRHVSSLAAACGSGWRDQGKHISRRRCLQVAAATGDGELSKWASSDVVWDEVLEVAAVGQQEVFDVSIPGVNCFLTDGGIVAHNSGAIEQHADHVLFTHRPKKLSGETLPDGSGEEAELILAKIRNGPTLIVPMLWFGKWMRWESPAGVQHQETQPYVDGGAAF